jgi:hypothetical protein
MHKKSRTIRNILIGVAATYALSGCSDHPSSGYLDTTKQRQEAKIVDISGKVYGIEKGTTDLVQKYYSDIDNLKGKGFYTEAKKAIINKDEKLPTLTLSYPKINGTPDMSNVEKSIINFLESKVIDINNEIQAEIDEAQKNLDEAQTKYDEIASLGSSHENSTMDEQTALDEAQKNLDEKIKEVDILKKTSLAEVNDVLNKGGQPVYTENQSPFNDYRFIDYSEKSESQETCQADRFRIVIDLISEKNMCLYLTDYSGRKKYGETLDELKAVYKKNFLNNIEKIEFIGQKGSWNTEASGLWLVFENAKLSLKNAESMADNKFGNTYQIANKMRNSERILNRQKETLDRLKSDDNLSSQMILGGFQFENMDENTKSLINDYDNIIKSDVKSRFTVLSDLAFNPEKENATFDNIKGDLEGYVVTGTIIAEHRGDRSPFGVVSLNNLLDPKLKDADELIDELEEKDAVRLPYIKGEDKLLNEIIYRIKKTAE